MTSGLNDEQRSDDDPATGRQPFAWSYFFLGAAIVVIGVPVVVLTASLLLNGFGLVETAGLVGEQMLAERRNLFLVGLPAVFPFLLLALLIFLLRRRAGFAASRAVALAGGFSIVVLLVWANASYWPMFLPGAAYPGFPHGLEMIIAPLFFAPVAMLVGALLAVVGTRR